MLMLVPPQNNATIQQMELLQRTSPWFPVLNENKVEVQCVDGSL